MPKVILEVDVLNYVLSMMVETASHLLWEIMWADVQCDLPLGSPIVWPTIYTIMHNNTVQS